MARRAPSSSVPASSAALAQLQEFAHAAGEDALHRRGVLGVLRGRLVAGRSGWCPTRTRARSRRCSAAHALQGEQLAEDGRPAGHRHDQQAGHHELHRPGWRAARGRDRQVLVHGCCRSLSRIAVRRECVAGRKRCRRRPSRCGSCLRPAASSPRQRLLRDCQRRAAALGAARRVTSSSSSSRAGREVAHAASRLTTNMPPVVARAAAAARCPASAATRCARARRTSGSWRRRRCRRRRCLPSRRAREVRSALHAAADRRRCRPAHRLPAAAPSSWRWRSARSAAGLGLAEVAARRDATWARRISVEAEVPAARRAWRADSRPRRRRRRRAPPAPAGPGASSARNEAVAAAP